MQLNPNVSFAQTLHHAMDEGQGVILHLRSGESLQGQVGAVAEHQVVIAELVNREFYDALVRIDEICAIEVRAR